MIKNYKDNDLIVFNSKNIKTGEKLSQTFIEKKLIEFSKTIFYKKTLLDLMEQTKHLQKQRKIIQDQRDINNLMSAIKNQKLFSKLNDKQKTEIKKVLDL